GLEIAWRIEIVAGPHNHVVIDDDRRRRQEILLVEVGDFLVPALLAGACVERDEVVVRRDEEKVVAPHGSTAIADVRGTARPPEEPPQQVTILRIERPDIVGRCHIQNAVDREYGALHGGRADELIVADAALDDCWWGGPEWRGGRPPCCSCPPSQPSSMRGRDS